MAIKCPHNMTRVFNFDVVSAIRWTTFVGGFHLYPFYCQRPVRLCWVWSLSTIPGIEIASACGLCDESVCGRGHAIAPHRQCLNADKRQCACPPRVHQLNCFLFPPICQCVRVSVCVMPQFTGRRKWEKAHRSLCWPLDDSDCAVRVGQSHCRTSVEMKASQVSQRGQRPISLHLPLLLTETQVLQRTYRRALNFPSAWRCCTGVSWKQTRSAFCCLSTRENCRLTLSILLISEFQHTLLLHLLSYHHPVGPLTSFLPAEPPHTHKHRQTHESAHL